MEILKNIEAIRKEKGIKQSVIAESLGVKQPAYSHSIHRSEDIWFGKLLQISNILEVSVIDIIMYPERYVPETEHCNFCKEKDKIIRNLNEYIETLKKEK